MRRYLLVAILIFAFIPFTAHAKKDVALRYDISCAGSTEAGVSLVNVAVYSKTPKVSVDLLKEAAVHGVIFKGYNDPKWGRRPPLAESQMVEKQHEEFFALFFDDGGAYLSYADFVEGGIKTVRVTDKDYKYKVSATLTVMDADLKRVLKDANIIKGMTNGF